MGDAEAWLAAKKSALYFGSNHRPCMERTMNSGPSYRCSGHGNREEE